MVEHDYEYNLWLLKKKKHLERSIASFSRYRNENDYKIKNRILIAKNIKQMLKKANFKTNLNSLRDFV